MAKTAFKNLDQHYMLWNNTHNFIVNTNSDCAMVRICSTLCMHFNTLILKFDNQN